MRSVVLIDDDKVLTGLYEEALQAQGFQARSIDDTGTALVENYSDCDLIVCDIAMPDDGHFDNEGTRNGLLTGLRLISHIRNDGCEVPCVLLTNINLPEVIRGIEAEIKDMKNVILLKKAAFNPNQFAQIASGLIEGKFPRNAQNDIVDVFRESVLIKIPVIPGFVSIDINKLLSRKPKTPGR